MFRGKESSNRMELSRLVQELLNFGVLGSLQLWGGGGWMGVGVVGGCPHTCAHPCACTHTCTHMVNMQMATPIGESLGIPYDVIHAYACMCVHVHLCKRHPLTTPHPQIPTPHPLRRDAQNQSKFNSS